MIDISRVLYLPGSSVDGRSTEVPAMSVIVARSEKNQHTSELFSAKLCFTRSAGRLGLTYFLFSDYTVTPSVLKNKNKLTAMFVRRYLCVSAQTCKCTAGL